MKKTLPLVITFITGLVMTLEYFSPHPYVQVPKATIEQWSKSIMAAMIVLGTINIVTVNVPKIMRRERDWAYKAVMIAALLVTAVVGFFFGPFDQEGTPAYWLYDSTYVPLSATMFSLLAFYIASAAFRAFRARSVEATLLLVTATIVMLGRVPLGDWVVTQLSDSWAGALPDFVSWINQVPNLAGKRAIMIGAALGAISTGVRVILGLERSYLSQ